LAGLLAARQDSPPDGSAASRFTDAQAVDRSWWLKLSRNLNGNAARSTVAVPSPKEVEGEPACIVREGTLKEAGMTEDAFDRIDAVLSTWAADTDQPFTACVARNGVIVLNKAYGESDGQPIGVNTTHWLASITKAMSGALLMMFVDRGLVSLDDPVEEFLPEFAGHGVSKSATLHHLFTHTGGMESHRGDGLVDLEHIYGGHTYPQLQIGKEFK
jgi:CubicO group peptidase (beta-lactamase class C family)